MVRPEEKKIGRFPYVTVAIVVAALVAYAVPALGRLLVYDRSMVVQGQVWRMVSGSIVHFSPAHLFYNLVVLLPAGWLTEARGYPLFGVVCAAAALLTGFTVFLSMPDIASYAGLSGVTCAAVFYLALHALKKHEPPRVLYVAILALTVAKIVVEYAGGRFLFVDAARAHFVPVPLAHVMGAAAAVLVFGLYLLRVRKTATTLAAADRRDDGKSASACDRAVY